MKKYPTKIVKKVSSPNTNVPAATEDKTVGSSLIEQQDGLDSEHLTKAALKVASKCAVPPTAKVLIMDANKDELLSVLHGQGEDTS
jgi:hypothetical protein